MLYNQWSEQEVGGTKLMMRKGENRSRKKKETKELKKKKDMERKSSRCEISRRFKLSHKIGLGQLLPAPSKILPVSPLT